MAARSSTSSRASEHLTDGGGDALGDLAGSVERPRSSLQAFSRLSEEQLELLARAVEATAERRQAEVDAALAQVLSGPTGRTLRRVLGRAGTQSLRALLSGLRP